MTPTNFNDLWQSQLSAIESSPREIVNMASKLQVTTRRKTIFSAILLLLTLAFIPFILFQFDAKMMTTKIGAVLVIIAIVMQIVASGNLLPTTKQPNDVTNANEYLNKLILLKKRQVFMQTTILSIYFLLLILGIFLYIFEFALKMPVVWAIFTYVITGLYFVFIWFYLRPKIILKQQQKLDVAIANLEKVTNQFIEEF